MPAKPQSLTITPQEMLAVSRLIKRDFAPQFFHAQAQGTQQTPFTSQELRDIANHISRQYSHSSASRAAQLLLLPIAPGRLHLFWQLGPNPPQFQPEAPVSLRLFAETDDHQTTDQQPLEIPLQGKQGHGELQLPTGEGRPGTAYQAVIGWRDEQQRFQPLLQSNSAEPAATPRAVSGHVATAAVEQSLTALASGISSVTSHSGSGKTTVHE